ncbi:unnamed protein product [Ascophyllum nodosum]
MVVAAVAAEAPAKKMKPASGSSESSKATKSKRSAKNKVVADERRDRKRSVEPSSRTARALPCSSGGHGNEAGSAIDSSLESHSDSDSNLNSESDWESESNPDSDNEDIAEDPVFAPGRYAFLVPSKKSNRPILVGKIVQASESPAGSVSAAASASPSLPPTIPASSATALLLAKAAELLVVRSEPGSPGATGFVDGAGAGSVAKEAAKEAAPDPVDDDERRWIHVHWHTPASLNRKDYCRGPFTPDYVKKEGTKCGGWDPFVTKIRKRSVAVTCPGLLVSRCIPAEVLRELAV